MAVAKRFSMFEECVSELKMLTADVFDKSRYTRTELLLQLRNAINSFNDAKGIASSRLLKYAFRSTGSDALLIDREIYENEDNVKMDYELEQISNAAVGSVETIAKSVIDKQIALLAIYWNLEGTTGVPTLDVSFDKDVTNGEVLRGTFLVEDERINPIENGVMFDTSMFVARTFSIRWSFPIGSDYKIKDTMVKVMLVDSAMFIQNQYDLARLAASNMLKNEATRAAKEGQSESYINFLRERAQELITDIQGKIGVGVVPSSSAGRMEHGYDRDRFADRAFYPDQPDGEWVAVIGNEIVGRTIRYVD